MSHIDTFRDLALSFSNTTEEPHFEKTSFRIGKKIFATLDIGKLEATVKLSEIDQNVFSTIAPTFIYPVPNSWGKQGWTIIHIDKIPTEMLEDVLKTAYNQVSGNKTK